MINKYKREVKPFTNFEILLNYKRIVGRNDFNKYFTKQHLAQAEIIFGFLLLTIIGY